MTDYHFFSLLLTIWTAPISPVWLSVAMACFCAVMVVLSIVDERKKKTEIFRAITTAMKAASLDRTKGTK